MKKIFLIILSILIFTITFSTTCFAAKSPNTEPINVDPTPENPSAKSPKTGIQMAFPAAVIITATGILIISKKKFTDAE